MKLEMEISVFASKVLLGLEKFVSHVLFTRLHLMKNVFAKKSIHGMKGNGDVYQSVENGQCGIMINVSVSLDVDYTKGNANHVLLILN